MSECENIFQLKKSIYELIALTLILEGISYNRASRILKGISFYLEDGMNKEIKSIFPRALEGGTKELIFENGGGGLKYARSRYCKTSSGKILLTILLSYLLIFSQLPFSDCFVENNQVYEHNPPVEFYEAYQVGTEPPTETTSYTLGFSNPKALSDPQKQFSYALSNSATGVKFFSPLGNSLQLKTPKLFSSETLNPQVSLVDPHSLKNLGSFKESIRKNMDDLMCKRLGILKNFHDDPLMYSTTMVSYITNDIIVKKFWIEFFVKYLKSIPYFSEILAGITTISIPTLLQFLYTHRKSLQITNLLSALKSILIISSTFPGGILIEFIESLLSEFMYKRDNMGGNTFYFDGKKQGSLNENNLYMFLDSNQEYVELLSLGASQNTLATLKSLIDSYIEINVFFLDGIHRIALINKGFTKFTQDLESRAPIRLPRALIALPEEGNSGRRVLPLPEDVRSAQLLRVEASSQGRPRGRASSRGILVRRGGGIGGGT